VAQLVLSRHAQVHALLLQLGIEALVSVREDCFILAAILFDFWSVFVPAFATLAAVDIKAVARCEVGSCFTPNKRDNGVALAPPHPADSGGGRAADI
jgi:hypothetical protein